MCGIFGYFSRTGKPADRAAIEKMGLRIAHRGPDDQGIRFGDSWALGNQRLSVIDIESGHQPMESDDGRVVVVQNGEIYNYVELRKELELEGVSFSTNSDTEVILRMYESKGIEAIRSFNGMFAIAIYDSRYQTLFLVRDRIGIKPLYIYDDGDLVFFASEIKSLLVAGVPRRPDRSAIHDFLTFNYCPPPATAFENVKQLNPGHYMTIVRGQPSKATRWWDLSRIHSITRSEEEWLERIIDILTDAVRIRLRSDVPFGAFLSGGIDSSTIVGLMTRFLPEPAKTFSIGFEDPRFDESIHAKAAADRFGADHHSRIVKADVFRQWPLTIYHTDQPHGDASFMPTYLVSRLAREHVTVVLTGDGGDELFAGYEKYQKFFCGHSEWMAPMGDLNRESEFREAFYRDSLMFTDELKHRLYSPSMRRDVAGKRSMDVWTPFWDAVRHFDPINQVLYLDMVLLLSGNNLVKPDRMGMAVSLEARTPFLDYRMMELAFQIPGSLKLWDGETKYILKKAVTDLIGDQLAYRRKQMFTVPIGEWFKDELYVPLKRFLLSDRTSSRGYFERRVIEEMLESHRSGKRNLTRELRALAALEIWHRIFIDQSSITLPDAETIFEDATLGATV